MRRSRSVCGRARRTPRRAWPRLGPRACRSGVRRRRRRVSRRARSSPCTTATAARPRRPSNATGRTTSSRQSVSSSRNACDAVSVSPVSSAARPTIAAVEHRVERIVKRARDRSRARGEVRCVTLAAETERGVGRGGEQVRELMDVADVGRAARRPCRRARAGRRCWTPRLPFRGTLRRSPSRRRRLVAQ